MFVLILKPQSTTRVIACVFFSTNHTWIHHYSHCMCVLSTNHIWINQSHCMCVLSTKHIWIHLSNCMFVLILKPQTSTTVIACVFFSTNHTWIHQWSLHVCSFHKPHMDQALESLHVCYFHKQTWINH